MVSCNMPGFTPTLMHVISPYTQAWLTHACMRRMHACMNGNRHVINLAVRKDLRPGLSILSGVPGAYPPTSWVSNPNKCPKPAVGITRIFVMHSAQEL